MAVLGIVGIAVNKTDTDHCPRTQLPVRSRNENKENVVYVDRI